MNSHWDMSAPGVMVDMAGWIIEVRYNDIKI
jgi:hypothetical protein